MGIKVFGTGKIYNGKVYDFKKDKEERRVFRGSVNYHVGGGNYEWVDVVAWGRGEGGMIDFLEEYFSATSDNAPKETGGQAIEFSGTLVPSKRKVKVPVKSKKTGKTIEIEVEVESKEIRLDFVDFPPNVNAVTKKASNELDDEFDDEDEFEQLTDDEDEISDEEEVEVKEEPKPVRRQKKDAPDADAEKKAPNKRPRKTQPKADDEEEFFE